MTTIESWILVLADDLTGALEVGAKFSRRGVLTTVTTEINPPSRGCDTLAQAMVIDTETRHLPASEAAARVGTLVRWARKNGFSHVYQKTDSTLRGNIASELEAVISAWPSSPLIYAPAYPKMGRTVSGGTLFVNGVPVGKTEFVNDELNSVRESSIPALIGSQCATPVFSIGPDALESLSSPAVYICDAETDEQIEQVAAVFAKSEKFHLAAGPAAFAGCLAGRIKPTQPSPLLPRNLRNGLVVNGSRNQISADQVKYAAQNGFRLAAPAEVPLTLEEDAWAILSLTGHAAEKPLEFAEHTGKIVSELLKCKQPDVLVVFGGDTAYAIVRPLGQPLIRPLGEIMEGVPVCSIVAHGLSDRLYLVTKAGGFSAPEALVSIRKMMCGE